MNNEIIRDELKNIQNKVQIYNNKNISEENAFEYLTPLQSLSWRVNYEPGGYTYKFKEKRQSNFILFFFLSYCVG